MKILRFVLLIAVLPFFLAACQTAQVGTFSFAGLKLAEPPVKKTAEPLAEKSKETQTFSLLNLRPAHEAASSTAKKQAKKQSEKSVDENSKTKPKKKTKLASRRSRYRPIITKHARAQGVPVKLAMAVVQIESNYRPHARGAAGEIGLMQIMPRTARYIGYKGKMKHLYNPDTNIHYGMKYLAKAYKLGGGSTCGAILKYNAGHGAKRMNKISRRYCQRVRRIMSQS